MTKNQRNRVIRPALAAFFAAMSFIAAGLEPLWSSLSHWTWLPLVHEILIILGISLFSLASASMAPILIRRMDKHFVAMTPLITVMLLVLPLFSFFIPETLPTIVTTLLQAAAVTVFSVGVGMCIKQWYTSLKAWWERRTISAEQRRLNKIAKKGIIQQGSIPAMVAKLNHYQDKLDMNYVMLEVSQAIIESKAGVMQCNKVTGSSFKQQLLRLRDNQGLVPTSTDNMKELPHYERRTAEKFDILQDILQLRLWMQLYYYKNPNAVRSQQNDVDNEICQQKSQLIDTNGNVDLTVLLTLILWRARQAALSDCADPSEIEKHSYNNPPKEEDQHVVWKLSSSNSLIARALEKKKEGDDKGKAAAEEGSILNDIEKAQNYFKRTTFSSKFLTEWQNAVTGEWAKNYLAQRANDKAKSPPQYIFPVL